MVNVYGISLASGPGVKPVQAAIFDGTCLLDDLKTIESLGFTFPSPTYLFGAFLFGVIGFAAYRYGKKTSKPSTRWIGLTLMLYPYAVSETWLLYVVGGGLCAGLYWWRE
jgi:hypothetical protein